MNHVPPSKQLSGKPSVFGVLMMQRNSMSTATLIKQNIIVVAHLQLRILIHYYHDRNQGSIQADMVLELGALAS